MGVCGDDFASTADWAASPPQFGKRRLNCGCSYAQEATSVNTAKPAAIAIGGDNPWDTLYKDAARNRINGSVRGAHKSRNLQKPRKSRENPQRVCRGAQRLTR